MHDTPPNDRSAMHSTIDRVRGMHRPQTMPIPFVVSKKAPIMSADSGMMQSAFWAMVCGIRETIENNTIYPQSFIRVSNPFIIPASTICMLSLNPRAGIFCFKLQFLLIESIAIIPIADGR